MSRITTTEPDLAPHPAVPESAEGERAGLKRVWRGVRAGLLRRETLAVFDQAVVSGTSFVSSVLIGRLCGREILGEYALAAGTVLFIQGIQEQLICTPFLIYAPRKQGTELAKYSGSALAHQGALAAVMCLLLFLGGLAAPAGWSSILLTLAWVSPCLLLREYLRQNSFALLRAELALLTDVVVAVLQLGGLLLCAALGILNVGTAFGVLGTACLVACGVWRWNSNAQFQMERVRIAADWKHNWRFARWTLAGQFTGSAMPYVLPWLLATWHGTSATGLFAACSTLVGLTRMFVAGVNNVVIPKAAHEFSAGGPVGLRAILKQTVVLYGITLGLFCAGVFLAGEPCAVWIFGEKYSGSAGVLGVLALNVLATALGQTAGNGLFSVERPRANLAADLVLLVVTVLVALWLIPAGGVTAAAWASLSGTTAAALWRWLTLRQVLAELSLQPLAGV